jgi:DNA (cytosine-5)-methyltransferase 1
MKVYISSHCIHAARHVAAELRDHGHEIVSGWHRGSGPMGLTREKTILERVTAATRNAGLGAGIDGERSGLWSEYARIVRVLRPRFVLVENVPALLTRGIGRVLGDLAASGFDAEWDCVPAAAVGAPHIRDRVFIFAHSNRQRCEEQHVSAVASDERFTDWASHADWPVFHSDREPAGDVSTRQEEEQAGRMPQLGGGRGGIGATWRTEPAVGRVANGVPERVDRLSGLGNAVVPQVAEWIGRRIAALAEG